MAKLPPTQANFALWYFDPEREGTQAGWAQAHGVNRTTLTAWKRSEWFLELSECWSEVYGNRFGDVIHTLYQKATDRHDFHQVQAAKVLGELLNKFPKKEVQHVFSISDYLKGEVIDVTKKKSTMALPEKSMSESVRAGIIEEKEDVSGQRSQDN